VTHNWAVAEPRNGGVGGEEVLAEFVPSERFGELWSRVQAHAETHELAAEHLCTNHASRPSGRAQLSGGHNSV
jgi:hypothetical protein